MPSRIVSGQSMSAIVLPELPKTPPPTGKRVVDSQELAQWYEKWYAGMSEWVKKVNTILQQTE